MLTWVLVIGGAVVGAAFLHFDAGFLIGAAFGFLFARVRTLGLRIETLQKELGELLVAREAGVATPPPPRPAAPVVLSAPEPAATATPPPEPAAMPEPAIPAMTDTQELPPAAEPPLWPVTPAEPSRLQTLIDEGLEWLRGGNPLARVGIVILFFGGAFLARYAAENSLFPLELRLAALAAGALVLLVIGWRLRDRRAVYAQILQGGGVAGLYLTVFAATRLYHLLPTGFALGLMVVVALAAALLAVAQNSLSLAVIGFAGGFMAPVLLSTGGGSHVALFSYYTVLNLGVFTVAWFRAWRVLNLVGFVFTFGITTLWRVQSYEPGDQFSADCFLLLFWALYVAVSVLFSLRHEPKLKGYVSGSLVFGLPVIAAGLHASLVRDIEYAMAWSALAFGAIYIALAWSLFRSGRDNLRLLAEAFAALGVIFASLAVPLAFDERAGALMWAVEGAGLMWLGLRQQRLLARVFSLLLQLAAGLRYISHGGELAGELLFLNGEWLASAALAVSGLLSAWWLQRYRDALKPYEQALPLLAAIWGAAWWFLGGLAELERHAPQAQMIGMALAFLAASLLLLEWIGRRGSWPTARRIAWMLMPPSLLVALSLCADAHPLAQYGFLGWPLLIAAGYLLLWQLDREADEWMDFATPALHGMLAWALLGVIAWEAHWQLLREVPGVWAQLPWGLAPTLLLGLLGARTLRPSWPLARHEDSYRLWVALPPALWLAVWIVGMNVSSNGNTGWLPYVPLLNPLDLSLLLALAALALWQLSLPPALAARIGLDDRRIGAVVIGALAFLTLSAALLRTLHQGWDTPLHLDGILHSTLVQAALSLFWSLLGVSAMLLATRRSWRWLWMGGAALMAVVVAKLFLLDLSGSGALARIASFLGVGALLLLTGYLSPLPPAARNTEPSA